MIDARSPLLEVAVAIVSYRSLEDLRPCLEALGRSTYRSFRVVICENGGPMALEALRSALPSALPGGQPVEIHAAPGNFGFAAGLNLCLRLAGPADAYWILNPDATPEPGALAGLASRLQRGDCDAVGHDILRPDGRLASRAGRWMAWSARAKSIGHGGEAVRLGDPDALEAVSDYVIGASMLVTPRFLELTGPMREDYFLYCDEIEWCWRALRAGLKLGYSPDARVVHAHGSTTGGGGPLAGRSKLAVYLLERNRLNVTRDCYPRRLPVATVLSLAHICLKYAKAGAWRQLGYGLRGWAAGIAGERGRPRWSVEPVEQGSPGPVQA